MSLAKPLACGLSVLSLLLAGCGGGSTGNPTTGATVTGTITHKGTPLNVGSVTMYGKDHSQASAIAEDGTYTIKDAPLGEVKIAVLVPAPPAKNTPQMPGMTAGPVSRVKLPPQYADKDTSKLTYEVKPGAQPFDIKLP